MKKLYTQADKTIGKNNGCSLGFTSLLFPIIDAHYALSLFPLMSIEIVSTNPALCNISLFVYTE